mmetsp:Transcript_8328/g.17810  ORF Transcript_8328/g.17810 Transcript_8328/m.17810 type:complete len:315 (+) Transcript_8328:22-966(+)
MATASEAEVLKLVTTAQSSCAKAEAGDVAEESRAVDALKALGKLKVTADLLMKTDAGKKVKKLCKHSSSTIKQAAAATVESWKECVKQNSKSSSEAAVGASDDQPSGSGRASQPEFLAGSASGLASQSSLGTASSGGLPTYKLTSKPPRSGDDTRDKIRDLLAEIFAGGMVTDNLGDPIKCAVEVETAMFTQNGGVNAKYKAKYRTLSFNLKDPNNPELRIKVLSGMIPGDVLVGLSPEELASDDRRQQNDKIRDIMKRECERGNTNQASTDMFQCGKCKQRKCTYYQMQTRSADEPMTTFVTCTVCGNRWKFC